MICQYCEAEIPTTTNHGALYVPCPMCGWCNVPQPEPAVEAMINRNVCPNPNCQSRAVVRQDGKAMHPDTRCYSVAAYWNTCLVCWRKWDGVVDKEGAILPAAVEARITAQVRYLVGRGWRKPEWSARTPDMWHDPLNVVDEYTLDQAMILQQDRDVVAEFLLPEVG